MKGDGQERKPVWGRSDAEKKGEGQERKPAWGRSDNLGKHQETSIDVLSESKLSSLTISSQKEASSSVPLAKESQPLKDAQQPGSSSDKSQTQKKQTKKSEDTPQKSGKSPPGSSPDEDLPLHIPVKDKRDSGGKAGRLIKVQTNHLQLNLSRVKNKIIFMYDVALDPERPKNMFRFAVRKFLAKNFPNQYPAYDGNKIMYSAKPLTKDSFSDKVDVSEREVDPFINEESSKTKSFTVTIKPSSEIDLSALLNYMESMNIKLPQKAIQAVDVILRQAPAFRFVSVGRSYFTKPTENIVSLGDGMDLWVGFYQSAILGWKSFLNIDVAHKAFPKSQPVLDLICEFSSERGKTPTIHDLAKRPIQPGVLANLNKYLKGLKVNYQVLGRKIVYRVNSLSNKNSMQMMLKDKPVSVYEYFKQERHVILRFPNLPLLHVGNPKSDVHIPVEFCTISDKQPVNRKLTEIQTANMVRHAATSAPIRKQKILNAIQALRVNENPSVKEFQLSVEERFTQVQARVLDPPVLRYGENKLVTPRNGVWNFEKYLVAQAVPKWCILNFNSWMREDELRKFAHILVSVGRNKNMNMEDVSSVKTIPAPDRDIRDLSNYLQKQKENGVNLVVVVIPDKGKDVYPNVKKVAEKSVGILTQCVKGNTLKKAANFSGLNNATVINILMKINAKMNGINYTLYTRPKCLERPVMFLGADVTHPSPDQKDIPSIAAVCASHDAKGLFQYNMECRLQPPRTEIIKDLEQMIVDHLKFFYKKTALKPERIFYFRDGVSEGEFEKVLNSELTAIQKACKRVQKENYEPPITFLVVQKRHHTRFFPVDPKDEDGKNRNVPAGTVVDTVITHPTVMDFYLVSHASIQGTSRPTRYRRLWDDSNPKMTEDELEQLTYYLCHMFSRCTRSVSYPAPTYYAHLAAFRARVYTEGIQIDLSNLDKYQHEIKQDIKGNYPMFFV